MRGRGACGDVWARQPGARARHVRHRGFDHQAPWMAARGNLASRRDTEVPDPALATNRAKALDLRDLWFSPHSATRSARVRGKSRRRGPFAALDAEATPSEGFAALNSGASSVRRDVRGLFTPTAPLLPIDGHVVRSLRYIQRGLAVSPRCRRPTPGAVVRPMWGRVPGAR